MGSRTEPGSHPITVGALVHALHHPVAAGLHPGPRRLRQFHCHPVASGGRHRRHLCDVEALTPKPHHRFSEVRHHSLHLLQMAPLQSLRRRRPVEGIRGLHAEAIGVHLSVSVAVVV